MTEKRWRYKRKCENCGNSFDSDKASKMFCGDICAKEYFEKKYPKQDY